jgi:hypothetical protein
MKEILKIALIFLFGTLTGFLIGHFKTDLLTLTWKSEVGLDSFINFFTGIAVAVFLNHAYQKHINDLRVEKDLIIDKLKEAIKFLREVREDFSITYRTEITKENLEKMVITFRQLSNSLAATKDIIDALEYTELINEVENIKLDFFIYKHIITGGKTIGEKYDSIDSQKQNTNYNKINTALHKLIVKINRT